MFNEKQLELLKYNLDGSRVKTRQQGNMQLSYLEGYDLLNTSNLIFGYGSWSYSITKLEQVSEEINAKNNKVIGYKAIVAVTVYDREQKLSVTREDVGFGTGISREYAGAHESGAKEAVTDGLKRALRSFGNQFGNALYDKSQRNVDHSNQQQPQQIQQQSQQNYSAPQSQQQFQDFSSLQQLGLEVQQEGDSIIVLGQTFGKQQTLKDLNFSWDPSRKIWHQPLSQQNLAA